MPELPEVETIVRGLRRKVLKRTFINTWTDSKKLFKKGSFDNFKKIIKNKKIEKIERRGKNIIFYLSQNFILLIHQKITGHLLFGKWEFKNNKWVSKISGPLLDDPMNQYIRAVFFLDNNFQIALSDLRKFAKIELLDEGDFKKEMQELGPEPLDIDFEEFNSLFKNKKGVIKQVLMDQKLIVGIGNIYASEILWDAKINPERRVEKLDKKDLKKYTYRQRKY